jgi:hypothetical protein
MSTDATQLSPSDAASLRTVLDLLLQDIPLRPVDSATLPWDQPIFILRSANMGRLRALLDEILVHTPTPDLHIMSHARDEKMVRELAPRDFTFHAYSAPGRYRLEEVSSATLDRLREVDFGILFFLDTGPFADLLDEVDRVLGAIRPVGIISFGNDGTCGRLPERQVRKRAESAFFRLVEWYHGMLNPVEAA